MGVRSVFDESILRAHLAIVVAFTPRLTGHWTALAFGRSLVCGAQERLDHFVVEGVAGLVGLYVYLERAAGEGEVADEVEEFVAGRFVLEAVGVVDGAAFTDDKHVAGGQVLEEAGLLHRVGLGFGAEGAGGGA